MSMIKVENLTFSHSSGYDNIFEDVNFQIDTNWKLGFVGRNGKGKTTFLHLLLGKYEYRGKISAGVHFDYFPFEVAHPDYLTFDIIRDITPMSEDWEIIKEMSLLDVGEDVLYQQFFTLSQGEQTKVMLAALFLKENEFLLIDEPTNHLDDAARAILCKYLNRKKGFILVSHDRHFLDGCVDHVLAINRANIEIQKGNFSTWWQNKEWQDGFEMAQNAKLKKGISQLEAAARQRAGWSDQVEKSKFGVKNSGLKADRGYVGHKAAKMMKSAMNLERRQQGMIDEKKGLLKNIDEQEALAISPLKYRDNRVCSVTDLAVSYDGKVIFDGIHFEICVGERVALQGKNGCGKSSILKLLCGQKIDHTGTVRVGSGVKISYISQSTDELRGSLAEYADEKSIDYTQFLTILRKLGFSREQFEKDIADFSGGQKKKVLLAGSLCEQAHLYIWDEPLNFIDVISRMQIEDCILEYQPTLLFVEHDRIFCDKVATKKVEVDAEKL